MCGVRHGSRRGAHLALFFVRGGAAGSPGPTARGSLMPLAGRPANRERGLPPRSKSLPSRANPPSSDTTHEVAVDQLRGHDGRMRARWPHGGRLHEFDADHVENLQKPQQPRPAIGPLVGGPEPRTQAGRLTGWSKLQGQFRHAARDRLVSGVPASTSPPDAGSSCQSQRRVEK